MFDIHQTLMEGDGDVLGDELIADYCDRLVHQFAASPEGIATAERYRNIFWVRTFLTCGFRDLGLAPPNISRADLEEIVFTLIPREVTLEAGDAVYIVGELRAFFEFLHRQYDLDNASEIIPDLNDGAVKQLELRCGETQQTVL